MDYSNEPRLTRDEFLNYWLEPDQYGMCGLDYLYEHIAEADAQYRSECALFGDAGPGQGHQLCIARENLRRVEERIEKLRNS